MARVLGLSFFFHDSAAALVIDGRIIAAGAEERFCRRKHTDEFPKQAVEYCLEAARLNSVNELDAVVFFEKPLLKFNRILETFVATWPLGLANFTQRFPAFLANKFNVQRTIEKMLPGYTGPILFTEHHMSHAASAFYCSPYEEAAILTIDGVGEWETTTIGHGRGNHIELQRAIHFPHSVGLLYSALTSYLGFQVNDGEWKVMGLAPYGAPRYFDQFRRLVDLKPDGSFHLNMDFFVHHYSSQWTAHHERWQQLFGFPRRDPHDEIQQHHEDLARSGQAVVEDIILGLAREVQRATGSRNLVIAGGVGLNSVANWKIEQQGIFTSVWIQPAAGDDGGALGAALAVAHQMFGDRRGGVMSDAYLGPEYSPEDIATFLDGKAIPFEFYDDDVLVERVAQMIAEGKVIGWFRGRMEFGPRALGARSVLADATNPDMKAIINRKIKYREYFRPFAPVVPLESVHEYLDVPRGTDLPFMLKVPPVRPEKRAVIPAVTHEDGTGRVQTVTEESNPMYYRVLKALERRTGVAVALNTSFNVRGEPMVCSPADAFNCFIHTGIDTLVLGNCIVTAKPNVDVDIEERYALSDSLEAQIARGHEPITARGTAAALAPAARRVSGTTEKVLTFYKELPFTYYSNAVDTAIELLRANRVKAYPALHRHLQRSTGTRVLDVGCGAGWFVNSCAHHYGTSTTGLDLNPVVLKQARAVARLIPGCESNTFQEAGVFEFQPERPFDVVNSLSVLHHTPDCHGAIRRALQWVSADGYLHLGLYHLYGRRPVLEYFARMRDQGASETELYSAFKELNPNIADETHMHSWFRNQVLHPHETQHTYEELHALLEAEGFVIKATSINNFKRLADLGTLIKMEKKLEEHSKRVLYKKKRYFPGFVIVWARRK